MRNKVYALLYVLFLIFLITFSQSNVIAVKNGLALWVNNVIPSLFPFFIATELLSHTDVARIIGKWLNGIMRPLFNVPGEGAYALLLGIISGYPVGAKIVANLYEAGTCTKNEAERLLAFTNNSGPLFVVGTVGILLFGNITIGILLLITHVLASLTTGILLGLLSRLDAYSFTSANYYSISYHSSIKPHSIPAADINNAEDLGSVLSISIKKAIYTILQIGGFVVLFSVVLSMLTNLHFFDIIGYFGELFYIPESYSKGVCSGLIELTNGVSQLSDIHVKTISITIILCAFLLGFGGISILLQVVSIVSKANLSIKSYITGKIFQGLFASLYTALLILFVPTLSFDLPTPTPNGNTSALVKIALVTAALILALGIITLKSKMHHKNKYTKYNLLQT